MTKSFQKKLSVMYLYHIKCPHRIINLFKIIIIFMEGDYLNPFSKYVLWTTVYFYLVVQRTIHFRNFIKAGKKNT